MNQDGHRYFIINKPFNMVSQFVSNDDVRLLGEIDFNFPKDIHAIGRLDSHSEGLLILTTNRKVTKLLFQGEKPHKRTYLVLVLKKVSVETVELLKNGVSFIIKGNEMYTTLPCDVEIIDEPNFVFSSPYTKNSYLEYSWLKISLTEGKYHQVRKMVATVGHKCVRLIRESIENLSLQNLQAGAVRKLNETDFFNALSIDYPKKSSFIN